MTKKPHDHTAQEFDGQLQQARQELGAHPEGAAAGLGSFFSFLAVALADPEVRALLWELWQKVHPTPQPAPPPESV